MPFKDPADKRAYQKAYRAANADRFHAQTKQAKMKYLYGLTPEAYEALLESQGGRCAICPAEEPGGRGRWHIDHDHACCDSLPTCGECVRGLLCANCNRALGMFGDDPEVLKKALEYLTR